LFFQAEDVIRVDLVTGVQTCALPISFALRPAPKDALELSRRFSFWIVRLQWREGFLRAPKPIIQLLEKPYSSALDGVGPGIEFQIGRASCRERREGWEVGGAAAEIER